MRKNNFLFLGALCFVIPLMGCGGDKPAPGPKHYLMIENTAPEVGYALGMGQYEYNSSVTVTASPRAGGVFKGWYHEEDLLSTLESYTFTMPNEDYDLVAFFDKEGQSFNFSLLDGSENTLKIDKYTGTQTNVVLSTKYVYKTASNEDKLKKVTAIGTESFYLSTSLESIFIPEGVTSIAARAFDECSSLNNVSIPSSVTHISFTAFSGCTSLEYHEYRDGKYLGNDSNACHALVVAKDSDITQCYVDNNCKTIAGGAFSGCTLLESIVIPNVTHINEYAFGMCTSLASFLIPNSVTYIGGDAFSDCTGLTSIIIPDSVTSMGAFVFMRCSKLTDIYCVAPEKPAGWDANWADECSATVHWNYFPNANGY